MVESKEALERMGTADPDLVTLYAMLGSEGLRNGPDGFVLN